MFLKSKQISDEDIAVTASIKALKTLTFKDGRVSIQPEEVLTQPGYEEARRQAARFVRPAACTGCTSDRQLTWCLADCDELAPQIARRLKRAKAAGMTYAEVLSKLENLVSDGDSHD
jgi:hypothetical protein